MHFVIMGCGRVGSSLARGLDRRGHSVAIIDLNPLAFNRLGATFRGSTVQGTGFDRQILTQAGIERADGFAAVANGDNSNILGARVARESFGISNVVARIYDPGRAEVYERLGIPTVATVRWATDQVMGKLIGSADQVAWRDPSAAVALVNLGYAAGWVGQPIRAIELAVASPVPALGRRGSALVTTPSTVLQADDELYVVVATDRIDQVRQLLASPEVLP